MRKLNYLVVLFVTALIFLTGVWIGDQIAGFRLDTVIQLQEDVGLDSSAIGLQMELLKEGSCNVDIFDATQARFELGRQIAKLEGQVGPSDENILRLKNQYSILNIQQFLLVNKQIDECGTKFIPILFFYDNVDAKSDSMSQGYVLDYVYKTRPKEVVIYSFDSNVRNAAVDTLIDQYDVNVSEAPVTVINGKSYSGVLTSKEIFNILGIAV